MVICYFEKAWAVLIPEYWPTAHSIRMPLIPITNLGRGRRRSEEEKREKKKKDRRRGRNRRETYMQMK